jgi:hypothetical protein
MGKAPEAAAATASSLNRRVQPQIDLISADAECPDSNKLGSLAAAFQAPR